MSCSQWHIRKWLLVISWILLGIVFIVLFPEHKVICFLVLVAFAFITTKAFYKCPHCKKSLDLRISIDEKTKCYHCGKNLVS